MKASCTTWISTLFLGSVVAFWLMVLGILIRIEAPEPKGLIHVFHERQHQETVQKVKDGGITIDTHQHSESFDEPDDSAAHKPSGLRYDWTNMTLTTDMAKRFEAHMTDCSLPLERGNLFDSFGLGAELHLWSHKLCLMLGRQWARPFQSPPWKWRDEGACGGRNDLSSLQCYFPLAELRCKEDLAFLPEKERSPRPKRQHKERRCMRKNATKEEISEFRAAGTEYLFQSVSPIVIQEAERQLKLIFPGGNVPTDLITVHIRWGDKGSEMKLASAQEYVKGVQEILEQRDKQTSIVSIYLATEDPKAVKAFRNAAPKDWTIYVDQYFHDMLPYRDKGNAFNQGPESATKSNGRAGLVALGSLLVAMEANDFVLTTASNWSRLMNELRKNVVEPRCGGCTHMVDLRYGEK